MYHVYAHQDDYLRYDQLDDKAQVNKLEDYLANENLVELVAEDRYISGDIPFEDVRLTIGSACISSSPTKAIYDSWGSKVARALRLYIGGSST